MRAIVIALSFGLAACATQTPVARDVAPRGEAAGSSIPAALAGDAGASLNPADAPAGAYRLDPRHASVIWRVRHTGLGIFVARFDAIAADLRFDPQNPAVFAVDVTIDANSVSTGVLDQQGQGRGGFDREIASVLGASAAPRIHFVSRTITVTGPTTGLIEGDLTLNGQTHPVTLETQFQGGRFVLLRNANTLAFSGRTIIQRAQWGVGSALFDQFAGDAVEILIEAEFVKA